MSVQKPGSLMKDCPVLCLSLLLMVSGSVAQETQAQTDAPERRSPHCGLYCVYALLCAWDKPADFSDLLKAEYLGSYKGSTLSELKQAAQDNMLFAECVGRLSLSDLCHCKYPVILHVKSDSSSRNYDHFSLFLGMEAGRARVFDPPETVQLIPLYELASAWDGNALIVSAEPVNVRELFAHSRKCLVFYAALAITFILAVRALRHFLPYWRLATKGKIVLTMSQGGVLVVATVLFGILNHSVSKWGFLAHSSATAGVKEACAGTFIAKVSCREMQGYIEHRSRVIVDARLARDYEVGHVQGAISLPVDTTEEAYRATVDKIDRSEQIVVYCQSSGCRFAERIAVQLQTDGFEDVSLFPGGWVELEETCTHDLSKSGIQEDEKNIQQTKSHGQV
ncbi:MAG: rhodanese-like domain-containing protein [Acetivibrionales bacterium]|jgi:rhodanese-related sulfurtransferase